MLYADVHKHKHYYYNVRHSPSFYCFAGIALEYTVCTLSDNICLIGCHLTLSVDLTGDTIHRTSSQWPIVPHRSCMCVKPRPHALHPEASVLIFLYV